VRISDDAEPVLAGERVVDLEAEPVERRFPPVVVGDDEGKVADQVRGVLSQQPAFLERLHHQRDVALFEVAHAAVHELRASARRALAEVVLLQSRRRSRGCRIDSDADAGAPPPMTTMSQGSRAVRGARSCRSDAWLLPWRDPVPGALQRLVPLAAAPRAATRL
jgi:hypothetical protein